LHGVPISATVRAEEQIEVATLVCVDHSETKAVTVRGDSELAVFKPASSLSEVARARMAALQ